MINTILFLEIYKIYQKQEKKEYRIKIPFRNI